MKRTGRELNRKWKVEAKHALYRKTGDWYHHLRDFPGALFDCNGYILFETEEAYKTCRGLQHRKHNTLHVPGGISTLPGYRKVEDVAGIPLIAVSDWKDAVFKGWCYLRDNPEASKVHVRYRGEEHQGVTEVVRSRCNQSDDIQATTLRPAIDRRRRSVQGR